MQKKWLAALLVLGCSVAQAQESNWRFFGRVGTGFGGENFASGQYANTGDYWELSAGAGMKYAVGADYRISDKITLQGSIAREVSSVPNVANGDLTFTRVPLELLGFYSVTKEWRVGGGLRYSTQPNMTGTGFAAGWSGLGGYEPNVGGVIEVQYLFATSEARSAKNAQFGLSLRYVDENFTRNGVTRYGRHSEAGLVLYY